MTPRPALALLLCASGVQAQDASCVSAVTQIDMNDCAERAWMRADEELNQASGLARARMRQTYAALPAADRGAEVALRDAQRACITYRDAACTTEGYACFGGSIRPTVVSRCLERLTRDRTQDLSALAQPH